MKKRVITSSTGTKPKQIVSATKLVKKRSISPEVQAKGAAALALWRKEKAKAVKKGGKLLAEWEADQELKRAQKRTSPMMAIKEFCVNCVETREDVKKCTAKQCPLWIYRPYKESD